MKTKKFFTGSKKCISILLAAVMLLTALPLTIYAEDPTITESDSYTIDGAYTAQYADPQTNEIKPVLNPIYRNNFDGELDDFTTTDGVGISNAAEREYAMHIGAATAAPGHYAKLNNNPFSGRDLTNGATVMGWNYYTVDKSGADFVPFITFYGVPNEAFLEKYDLSNMADQQRNDNYWYVSFTLGGYILISKGAIDGSEYTNYVDYKIDGNQDIVGIPYTSTTITTKKTATWTHYAFTITENAIKVYIAGVEYAFSTQPGAQYDTSLLENFNYLLDFLTLETTEASFSYGLTYWYADYDHYFDDVRFYDTALTQQQIRAIYGENDDCSYKYAEGHDPTIVYNETKNGNEFSYYMFGTGMTIYGSNDLANWYELADEQGRTGYQSTKLFGDSYLNVLGANGTNLSKAGGAMPLLYSAGGSGITNDNIGTGAGLMVWAPSVIYNRTTKKWQMFAATSSWGSPVSCIFVAEADAIEGPYEDVYTVMYSGYHDDGCNDGYANVNYYTNDHKKYLEANTIIGITTSFNYNGSTYPNCIDAAPFYDANGQLWMSYGSWSGGIYLVKLTDDGRYLDNENAGNDFDVYYGKKIAATSDETYESSLTGSSEGSFIYYDATTGYYYLTISYGAVHTGRYTMRTWRSSSVGGPYYDASQIGALTASTDDTRSGMKMMGNYNFPGANTHYYDNGHSSNLYVPNDSGTQEAGKSFIAYHTRMFDGYRTERAYGSSNYLNEARVHQVLFNQDDWQCILPYQYSGETFGSDDFNYSIANLAGTWSFLLFDEKVDDAKVTANNIRLNANGSVDGNYSGTWELVMDGNKPYLNLNLTIDDNTNAQFKGVFITMSDEIGNKRTVFSAVGETNGYKTMAWGAMQEALPPASSASDSELSMISSDGYDNIIYTHGISSATNYGSGSSSSYMFFGDIISDGTVPPENKSGGGQKYQAMDGVSVANNPGYEQGERATYIYIAEQYSVDQSAGAITDSNNNALTATEVTSDRSGYKKYILTGSIAGAGVAFTAESDDTKRFQNTELLVPYTSANGAAYTEKIYATVMPNPVSANAAVAAYRQTNGVFGRVSQQRDTTAFLRADGSTGTVVANTYEGENYIGNYAYLDNPVYISGLCGYTFMNNASQGSVFLITGANGDPTPDVNYAGAYGNNQGTDNNYIKRSTESGTVTASYYLDLSKLDDGAQQELGGLTVDSSTGAISLNLLASELQGYYKDAGATKVMNYTLSDNTGNFTWGDHTSTNPFGANDYNTTQDQATVPDGTTMKYDASKIKGSYSGVAAASAQQLQDLSATATFSRRHEGGERSATAEAIIGISVKVFDKSAIYDRLDNFDSLVQTDYTEETWADMETALRNATWYCNNYKLFDQDVNGNTVNPSEYIQELSDELTYAENDLFSYNEFSTFREIYELAQGVAENAENDKAFTDAAAVDALNTAIDTYDGYAFITVDGTTSEINNSNWVDIAAKDQYGNITNNSANYNADTASGGTGTTSENPAKLDYNQAIVELAQAINDVKSLTEYNSLELALYGVDSGTAVNDGSAPAENSSADLFAENTDETGALKAYNAGQAYTLESWYDFDGAYDAAVNRYTESGAAGDIVSYRQTEYKYTVGETQTFPYYSNYDPSTHEYTTDYVEVELQGTDLSAEQISINDAAATLSTARGNLLSVDSDEAYDAYNGAQNTAVLADLDAYSSNAAYHIASNLSLGYIASDGTVTNAAEYEGTDSGAVYVSYNDKIYKNTTTGETDPITADILNTINTVSNRKPYNVYFNVYIDGLLQTDAGEGIGTNTPYEQHYFGESVTFDGSAYSSYDIAKWEIKSANADTSIIKNTDYLIEREIQEDTTVNLYLTTPDPDAVKLVVMDYFGTRLDVGYVNVENNDFAYTVGDDNAFTFVDTVGRTHTVSVNEDELYSFTKWHWLFNEEGGITVIQQGERELPDGSYLVENGMVNGETMLTNIPLNTILTFTTDAENFVAWIKTEDAYDTSNPSAATWYVASYDADFSTFSRDTAGLTYVAITSDNANDFYIGNYFADEQERNDITQYQVPFSFGTATETIMDDGVEKFRLYCDYTIDEVNPNIEVVQFGVVCAKGDVAPVNFVKGADGVYTFAADDDSDYRTYTMTTSVKDTNTYMRSFVSYMYTDKEGNTIPRVAYGPVVCCSSDGTISK